MKENSIVGDLINFRGLVYSPMNENGVIFLFGKVMEDLNMYIEEIKPGFPDCIGRRFNGRGWEKISIEFEYLSSNFRLHKHNPKGCDMIICWEHDWPECKLEIIELKDVIKGLPNSRIKRPDLKEKGIQDDNEEADIQDFEFPNEKISGLFEKFDTSIKKIDDKIWSKQIKNGFSYYCPEKVFMYAMFFYEDKIKFDIFTGKHDIKGVEKNSKVQKKWGSFWLETEEQLPELIEVSGTSFKRIKQAIQHNEPTTAY